MENNNFDYQEYIDKFSKQIKKGMEDINNAFKDYANNNDTVNFNTMFNNKLKCDIYDNNAYLIYDIECPGFNKGDISVQLNNGNILKVSATHGRDYKYGQNYGTLISQERSYPDVSREFKLNDKYSGSDINVKYDGYNLLISLKKNTTNDSVNIDIQ